MIFRICGFLVAGLACGMLALGACGAEPSATPVCPYPTAHDAPLDSNEKLIKTTDDYSLYRVEFNGIKKGSRVPANLYIPRKSAFKAPYPAVLLQYGTGGNKNTNYIVAIGELAVAKGLAVLTIDSPGRGERKDKEEKESIFDMHFFQYLGDYSRATDFLSSRKEIDAKRLCYIGISWGAITGVTYCAHDTRIQVVASLVGGGDFAGLIPGGAPQALIDRTKLFDPYYNIAYIAPRPILLVNVLHDQLVPRVMADALQAAAPKYAKKVWLDCDHFFNGVDRVVEANKVIDFVMEKLPKTAIK